MQVTINIPDNLPQAAIQQQVHEFEEKLKQQAKQITPIENNTKEQKYQAIMKIAKKCSSLPTLDPRSVDDILGYEQSEMGLWGDE
jgi:DNA integrity scanning protein DisA with diadenylate cyclase activity